VENPTLEQVDRCRKDYLFEIAAHYGIPVSRALLKQELKSVVITGAMMEQGVFHLAGSKRSTPADDSEAAATGTAFVVGAPQDLSGAQAAELPEKKLSLSMPRFQPFSIDSTPVSNVGARLKVRLARLELEAKERARREELEFQLSCRKLEADTAIQIRQLELQSQKEAINQPGSSQSASKSLAFDVSRNIALVPPFRETSAHLSVFPPPCIGSRRPGLYCYKAGWLGRHRRCV